MRYGFILWERRFRVSRFFATLRVFKSFEKIYVNLQNKICPLRIDIYIYIHLLLKTFKWFSNRKCHCTRLTIMKDNLWQFSILLVWILLWPRKTYTGVSETFNNKICSSFFRMFQGAETLPKSCYTNKANTDNCYDNCF